MKEERNEPQNPLSHHCPAWHTCPALALGFVWLSNELSGIEIEQIYKDLISLLCMDLCNHCGKNISNNFDRVVDEEKGKLQEFHSDCHSEWLDQKCTPKTKQRKK